MRAAVTMPFGRHRGKRLSDLPDDYLCWLRDECDLREPLRMRVEREYQRRIRPRDRTRHQAPAAPMVLAPALRDAAARIILAGYRACAMRAHPDRGGSHDEMVLLTQAREALERLVGSDGRSMSGGERA